MVGSIFSACSVVWFQDSSKSGSAFAGLVRRALEQDRAGPGLQEVAQRLASQGSATIRSTTLDPAGSGSSGRKYCCGDRRRDRRDQLLE